MGTAYKVRHQRLPLRQLQEDTGQQQIAAQHVNDIAEGRLAGIRSPVEPDEEYGGNSQQLPEEDEGKPVTGKGDTQCAAGISHRAEGLHAVLVVAGVDTA